VTALVLTQAPPATPAVGSTQLVVAALLGIAVIVLLITLLDVHPFLALIAGAVLGLIGGLGASGTISSFTDGIGSTIGSVGVLIALGSMIGGLLRDSGGATRVVDAVRSRVGHRGMPWAMAGVAALIGLPLFFEVGVVLLVPVVVLVARRLRLPIVAVGIPALAGLSVLHGLVPPHPGPLVAIDALGANLGLTLLFGLATAIPTVLVAGPLFAKLAVRWVPVTAPDVAPDGKADVPAEAPEEQRRGGAVAVDPGVARGRRDPRRDRLGHRGHDHRRRDRGSARRGTGCTDRRPAGARRRGGLAVLLPRQRRRVLAGEGVLRADGRADDQELIDDGDRHLGGGTAGGPAALGDRLSRRVTRPVEAVPRLRDGLGRMAACIRECRDDRRNLGPCPTPGATGGAAPTRRRPGAASR
jgi:hypothetical protein